MAQYYAVERSSEYLAHYGVRGMKWGVRKAIASGNTKRLDRQYKKAQKKLAKLNKKANIKTQKDKEALYEKRAKAEKIVGRIGLGEAVSGTGAGHLIKHVINPKLIDKYLAQREANYGEHAIRVKEFFNSNFASADDQFDRANKIRDRLARDNQMAYDHLNDRLVKTSRANNIADNIRNIGIGTAIAGYSGYGINKLKAHNARKRTTAEGHKKAVSERNAWQREMNKAFAGTKYATKPRHAKKRK